MEVRTCIELLNLFDQVSLHLNQKCISTTKDLGKLQRNHKPPWKWKETNSLLLGRNNVLDCSLYYFLLFLIISLTAGLIKDLGDPLFSSANNLSLAAGKTLGFFCNLTLHEQFWSCCCPTSDLGFVVVPGIPTKGPMQSQNCEIHCILQLFPLCTHSHFGREVLQASRINKVLLSACRDSHIGWPLPHRGLQKDYRTNRVFGTDVQCWFVHNSGKGFIDGHYKDYLVPHLYSFLKEPWTLKLNQFIIENSSLLLHTQTGSWQPSKPDWPNITNISFVSDQCFKCNSLFHSKIKSIINWHAGL